MPATKIDVTGNTHFPMVATLAGYQDWRSLWQINGTLSAKRKNPFILFHGDRNSKIKHTDSQGKEQIGAAPDVIEIPEQTPKKEPGATDAHHPFGTQTDKVFLRLRVLDDEYVPIKDATWKLILDGMPYPSEGEGTFEAGGLINVQVRKTAQRGKLIVKWTPPAVQQQTHQPGVIEGTGGSGTPGSPDVVIITRNGKKVPHWSQGDPRWGTRHLGNADRTVASAGCAITSVAMILKYFGRDVDPATLDEYLDKNGGYSGNSVVWSVAFKHGEKDNLPKLSYGSKVTGGAMAATLDDRIKKNLPTLARVDYKSDTDETYNHFVVIVGKTKAGYVMNDPGTSKGDGSTTQSADNIIETTTRGGGGYKLVEINLVDVTEPPVSEPPPSTSPPPQQPEKPKDEKPKEPPAQQPIQVEFVIEVGKLNPIQEEAPDTNCFCGVQQRLNNLGLDAGPVDGVDGSATQGALRRFQRLMKIPVTGKPDAETQAKLHEIHDQPGLPPKEKLPDEPGSEAPVGTNPPPPETPMSPTNPPSSGAPSGELHPTGAEVLAVAREYSGGKYATKPDGTGFEGTGQPVDLMFKGTKLVSKDPQGRIHCVGYTYMTFIKLAEKYPKIVEGMDAAKFKAGSEIYKTWYCWGGSGPTQGCAMALVNAGIATKVESLDDAQAGDFCQIWRGTGNSGHSVIFLEWLMKDGKRIGIKYRSAQSSTGVADSSEKFVGEGGFVNPSRLSLARIIPK